MNKISCSFMTVSQCNALVYIVNVFVSCSCSIGNTYCISFHAFEDFLFFELEAIPFWYRLLEPMVNRIGYQVLIKCEDDIPLNILPRNFSYQRLNDWSIRSKHFIKCNKTLFKKSINSDPHLGFHLAFIRRPKLILRTNAYSSLF